MTKTTTCIVGAGHAGGELALALRRQGDESRIILIGEEPHPPYERPPLSKAYLKDECEAQSLYLRQQAVYERAAVQLLLKARVERIDPQARAIWLADGRKLEYAQLALTTGGRPKELNGPDAARARRAENFHFLRTIEDAGRVRDSLKAGQRLVIVGGGYIGLEVAAAAVSRGVGVTVLEALPRVLARVTAPQISRFYEQAHRQAGVDVRTGVAVVGFDFHGPGERIAGVRCDVGVTIAADLVVVGIGIIPNTELAQAAGLTVDDGIVVDQYARTSDYHIVAAGDCTTCPIVSAGRRVRLESVPNAVEQARTAAATLAGKERPYYAVPWFWSDQYDLKLQMCGLSVGYDAVVQRGSTSARAFTIFYLRCGKVIAAHAVNRPSDFVVARRLVGVRRCVDPLLLADEAVPLKVLAPA